MTDHIYQSLLLSQLRICKPCFTDSSYDLGELTGLHIRFQAFRSYFHRLLTWQNSEKLCIVLEQETDLGAKASTYGITNTTILDAEILTKIFPGLNCPNLQLH